MIDRSTKERRHVVFMERHLKTGSEESLNNS
jgi:hypothetical protein